MSATKAKVRLSSMLLNGAVLLSALTAVAPAHAQMPAFLPVVEDVQPGEATDVDGTYVVSTINKRITIENGRAYVVDGWTHAFILAVQPGMVTLQNFRQTGPDTYEADDLPMMGKVVFNRQPNGTLQGVVQGALGEAKYALVPTEYATVDNPGSSGGGSNETPVVAQDRVYRLHVSKARCLGNSFRNTYGGVFNLKLKDANGNRVTSKNRNFKVKCTKKGPRSQTYAFYNSGPGALTITVPPEGQKISGMRVGGKNTAGKNIDLDRAHSSLLTRAMNNPNDLAVGQKLKDETHLTGENGKASLYVTLTLERMK